MDGNIQSCQYRTEDQTEIEKDVVCFFSHFSHDWSTLCCLGLITVIGWTFIWRLGPPKMTGASSALNFKVLNTAYNYSRLDGSRVLI